MGQLAGVSLGGPAYTQSQAELDSAMQGVVCTGSRWIRFDIRWSLVQGSGPSVSDWSVPDRLVTTARAHGLSVLGILDTTPGWAQAADAIQPLTQWGVPARASDFGVFASAAASRYRGAISAWEIWNEPNNPTTFLVGSPSIPSNGGEYGRLVNAAAPAIAAADPAATILVGAIAAPGPPPTSVAAPDAFLRAMYAVLTLAAHQAFTAVSYHPYTWNSPPMDASNPGNGFVLTPGLHQVMVDNGDGGKQIWGTEISWVIAAGLWPFTAQQQADNLTAGYAAWHAWPFTGPLLWYTWWDSPDVGYGLIDQAGLPRPSLTALTVVCATNSLPAPGVVSGVVTNAASGALMAAVTVTDGVGGSAWTNGSGTFSMSGLAPGGHTLTAAATGFTSQTLSTSVTSGQTASLNFALTAKPPASTTPQLVQAVGKTETTASRTVAVTLPVTSAGHLLVLSASVYSAIANAITSVTDAGGNRWTKIGAFATAGRASDGEMWYAANANPTTSVTVNLASSAVASLEVQEFSGVSTASPLDVSRGSSKSSTSPSSGSATPSGATDLVVGFVAGHGNTEAISLTGAGYAPQAQRTSNGGGSTIATMITGYKVLASASTQTFTGRFSAAMYWAAGIATFKAAPTTLTKASGATAGAGGRAARPL